MLSADDLALIRASSTNDTTYRQLVDLFERRLTEADPLAVYRLLANHFPEGVVALIDHDLRVIGMHGQGLAQVGLEPQTVQGRSLGELFSDAVAARDEPNIRAALQGEARITEVSYDGRDYRVHSLPVRNASHEIVAALIVTQDVTLYRQAVATEHAARLKAEQADQIKLRFIAMVSHELRTPLASIKGFASTLRASDVTFPLQDQQEFLSIIDEETDRLIRLVEQLLDLTRLDAGMLSVTAQPQPLEPILRRLEARLTRLMDEHTLEITLPASLPLVLVDADRVAEVVTNLVENATRHTLPRSPIAIRVSVNGPWVQVDVIDQGPGIRSADRTRVFEPFFQVPKDNGARSPGTGLGLAICKGLVEAHGGRIWIAASQKPGTTVSFTLPRIDPP